MKRKEYFKQSLWNTFKNIASAVIFILMVCLSVCIAFGILYFMGHCMSEETLIMSIFIIAACVLSYIIIKRGLMLIFNIYHFFVCLYLVDKLNDRQFTLYKKFVYGYGASIGKKDTDVIKYLKKFNPIRYRKYKNIIEHQEE